MDYKTEKQHLYAPQLVSLVLHQQTRQLAVSYADGQTYSLSFEFLRVHSPSAQVQGHGPGQETLQYGKAGVNILDLTPVGHYAVQPHFSDGHNSGLFSWDYLYFLATQQQQLWPLYLDKLAQAGLSRNDPNDANGPNDLNNLTD